MEIYFKSEKGGSINLTPHSGKNGISAYEVAVKNGFSGSEEEWLLSLKGEKGDAGKSTKSAVIIGNANNGNTLDICDILYNEGDDFSGVFAEATSLCRSLGINRIEILQGEYLTNQLISVYDEVHGIGDVTISTYDDFSGTILFLRGDVVSLENLKLTRSNYQGLVIMETSSSLVYMKNMLIDGEISMTQTQINMNNCQVAKTLSLSGGSNSVILNSEIDTLNLKGSPKDVVVMGCKIGTMVNYPDGCIIRDNKIGGAPQTAQVMEQVMGVSFGRVNPSTAGENIVLDIEPESFEIFVNESSSMSVNIYTNGTTPAKTLNSDFFMFINGKMGDDVEDGNVYRKTFIMYLKSTLGVATLGKWIALSGSDIHQNRLEIVCPPDTYRGVIKNGTEAVNVTW